MPGQRRRRLLVVVDQFEEVLTQTPPPLRRRFVELMEPALAGPVHLVVTLRPEFLEELLVDPALAGLRTRTYTLRPLRREALRSVIRGPSRLVGIEIGEELEERLIADTDSGEALPLLAFTLAQLAEGVGRGGRLSEAHYIEIGGVNGALNTGRRSLGRPAGARAGPPAGHCVAAAPGDRRRPRSADPPPGSKNTLPDAVAADLDAFVARRLLTTDDENDLVVVGVAHEAFLSAWPPLAGAIVAAISALRAGRRVEQAATEWTTTDVRRPACGNAASSPP